MNLNLRALPRWLAITLSFAVHATPVANAADFNITIPLRLANLPPHVDLIQISCFVDNGTEQASGSINAAVSGGALNTHVVIGINANPGINPATYTHYRCAGNLSGTLDGARVSHFLNGARTGRPIPLAAGSAFNLGGTAFSDRRPLP